jgi:type I restriction-modification system DNA methylase subunit
MNITPFGEADNVAEAHQLFLESAGLRTAQGAFYTPFAIVERTLELSFGSSPINLHPTDHAPFRVIDPACGTGNFLLVAALRLASFLDETELEHQDGLVWVVENCIYGADLDPEATRLAVENLVQLTGGKANRSRVSEHFYTGNALLLHEEVDTLFGSFEPTWSNVFPEVFTGTDAGFDAVIGNPPFLNQLNSETALDASVAGHVKKSMGDNAKAFTNTATLFLATARQIIKAQSGRIAFIEPLSIIATRDSDPLRQSIDNSGHLQAMWICEDQVFDAAVQTCVVFIDQAHHGGVKIYAGKAGDLVSEVSEDASPGEWSRFIYAARSLPKFEISGGRTLAEIAEATNDFRDEYYGLIGHVIDSESADANRFPKLLTVGKVDLAQTLWGDGETKFAKDKYLYPRVDIHALSDKLQKWAGMRLQPKVIVATQTRIVELYVDEEGEYLPSIPLASVTPLQLENLWKVAACLAAPPISLLAYQRLAGAGMSAEVLKLSARNLLKLPLPSDDDKWSLGSEHLRNAHALSGSRRTEELKAFGYMMCGAYGLSGQPEIMDWWLERL